MTSLFAEPSGQGSRKAELASPVISLLRPPMCCDVAWSSLPLATKTSFQARETRKPKRNQNDNTYSLAATLTFQLTLSQYIRSLR